MLIIIGLIIYQYVSKVEDGDYLKPLKQIPADIKKVFQTSPEDAAPVKSELAPLMEKARKAARAFRKQKEPSVAAVDDATFVVIDFVQGGSIEGKVLQHTPQNDYVLALPGGNFSVKSDEIKSVRELTGDDAAILRQQIDGYTPEAIVKTDTAAVTNVSGPVKWYKSIDQAIGKAQHAKKIVMVDFSTDWCGWCKKLDKDTFQNRTVQQILNNYFVCVKIDGDERKDLVRKYRVPGYPHVLFITGTGKVTYRVPGYVPPNEFVKILNTVKTKK